MRHYTSSWRLLKGTIIFPTGADSWNMMKFSGFDDGTRLRSRITLELLEVECMATVVLVTASGQSLETAPLGPDMPWDFMTILMSPPGKINAVLCAFSEAAPSSQIASRERGVESTSHAQDPGLF
eukprot:jgi/Botrbrau1/21414/Bobra.0216s0031.1